jgi:hypothetical protein
MEITASAEESRKECHSGSGERYSIKKSSRANLMTKNGEIVSKFVDTPGQKI